MNNMPEWMKNLDERERREVEFAMTYADVYHHGTTGHNQLMLIAKLARMLNEIEEKEEGKKDE